MDYPDEIKERIKNGMGCYSQIGVGWFDLVRKLDSDISKLVPNYTIDQIKEKFGGLRYYIGSVPSDVFDEVHELIRDAEDKSMDICDVCGDSGRLIGINGWMVTRCEIHE